MEIRQAFVKTLPVMAGYIVLGIGFGILLRNAGYGVPWAFVLPPAMIGMLVIYCLKDVDVTAAPFALPELIAAGCVVLLQIWKRNTILSILAGTAVYMVLTRVL